MASHHRAPLLDMSTMPRRSSCRLVRFASKVSKLGSESCEKYTVLLIELFLKEASRKVKVDQIREVADTGGYLAGEIVVGEVKVGELGEQLETGGWELRCTEIIGGDVEVLQRACSSWPRNSRKVIRPSPPPQRTPFQWQQSVPATHDRKAAK
uniref:Uncharacterized protein n=1 Tax=Oryza punctata TaxID=4537 RepID=A0A0E0MKS3_ORYPU